MTILDFSRAAVAFICAVGLGAQSNNVFVSAQEEQAQPIQAIFVNQLPKTTIDLYWEDPNFDVDHPDRRHLEVRIAPRGAWHASQTFLGHEFSYEVDGKRHFVLPRQVNSFNEAFVPLAGDLEGIRVRCEVSVNSKAYMDYLDIVVKPYWAPRGASRFLELVRRGYYDGVALNRVVPQFLTQFGIAKDYETRTKQREIKILDDFDQGIKFEPGTVSFAGSGHDSRTTEIFIVMPGASEEQLNRFGENSWETPFAVLDGDVQTSALNKIYAGYRDQPPWGKGPDSNLIYDIDGYTKYLPKKFPKLDYIDKCYVVDEVGLDEDFSEGEF